MAFLKPPLYSVLYSRFFFWLHPGLMHKSYVAITVAGAGEAFRKRDGYYTVVSEVPMYKTYFIPVANLTYPPPASY